METYLIIFLARVIIDIVFLVIIFFILAFYTPYFLNYKVGINIGSVGAYTIAIVVVGLVLVDYLLVKNNIPLGFTDLMRMFGFLDNDCQYTHLFSKCL